jgi:signal recognition particle subunit SRP54
VSLPIVRQFVKNVEEKALGVKVIKGVRPDQQLVKVVNDQLVELMGGQQEDLNDPKNGPQVTPGLLVNLMCNESSAP